MLENLDPSQQQEFLEQLSPEQQEQLLNHQQALQQDGEQVYMVDEHGQPLIDEQYDPESQNASPEGELSEE